MKLSPRPSPALAAAILALSCLVASKDASAGLDVDLDGVEGQEKINVESFLAIRRYAATKEAAASRIRHLHEQAPEDIAKALEPFGYFRVQVDGSLEQDGDDWKATYRIDPGEPVRFDTVTVRLVGDGAEDPILQDVVATFPVQLGDPVNHLDWELGKANISGQAHVRGYLDGRFQTNEIVVDLERYAARLMLVYDTGARYEYGPVRFEQDVLDQRYLDGYVPFEQGDSLDFQELRGFQNSLRSTNYFKRVEVEPVRDEAVGNQVPIQVILEPNRPLKLDFGVSYGTDEGFGALVGALVRRVNRRGHRADAEIRVAQTKQSAAANYRIPWANPPTSILSFSTGYERDDTESRLSETFLVATSFARLRGSWQETIALAYRNETYEVGPDAGRSGLFGPDLQWSLIRADNRVFTRRGFRVRAGLHGSLDGALASVTYGQANLDLKGILGGKSPHRMIGRAKVGHTFSDQFRELPASIRYFAGGAQSIRGYGYEAITPRNASGEPIGGENLLETGVEYDYRLLGSWAVAGFYDLGGALESFSDALSHGVGFGLRWLSPVGMIRLDYAWGLSTPGVPTYIHFMIGPDL